jgi:hypothetical protein
MEIKTEKEIKRALVKGTRSIKKTIKAGSSRPKIKARDWEDFWKSPENLRK